MKALILILLAALSVASSQAKLLDKITTVINDRVITLSEFNRVKNTLKSRNELSALIYQDILATPTDKMIAKYFWRSFIIRDKLSGLGYVVTDDMVEERIKSIEARENVRRDDLLEYLNTKGLSYNEYFELMRETIEYNIFLSKVITPLVFVTDQEIKNFYYNNAKDKNTMTFVLSIYDYVIDEKFVQKQDLKSYKESVQKYHTTGIIPELYSSIEKIDFGTIAEGSLSASIKNTLKGVNEGEFSKVLKMNGQIHIFYVYKKDLKESSQFLKIKPMIQAKLTEEKVKTISVDWFDREFSNYYIKSFF